MSGRHNLSRHPHDDTTIELVRRPLRQRLIRPGGRHRPHPVIPTQRDWTGEVPEPDSAGCIVSGCPRTAVYRTGPPVGPFHGACAAHSTEAERQGRP